MSQRLLQILTACGTTESRLPATALYNEGWMLRLVLDWFCRTHAQNCALAFAEGATWYSEALLHTQFRARRRGDSLAEAWTHADGVIGHFSIGGTGRGDLRLNPEARQFVVTEAKMFSGLSRGTTRANSFDQAARNVACIAEALSHVERNPADLNHLGFVVLAPREQIQSGVFGDLVTSDSIQRAVCERVDSYAGEKSMWYNRWFIPTLEVLRLDLLSWEDVVDFIRRRDANAGGELGDFLAACYHFNRGTSFSHPSAGGPQLTA